MNQKNLLFILIIDLILIIGAIYLIGNRYSNFKQNIKKEKSAQVTTTTSVESQISTATVTPEVPVTVEEKIPEQTTSSQQIRNILFQYRRSTAKNVAIIGDFNDWVPQPLEKHKNVWKIIIQLAPGEYLYNFLVDGKVILDPNNHKEPVMNKERGFKSSILIVKSVNE